jgi:hypothetical protein
VTHPLVRTAVALLVAAVLGACASSRDGEASSSPAAASHGGHDRSDKAQDWKAGDKPNEAQESGPRPDVSVRVSDGSVRGTSGTETVTAGERVTIVVAADEADEVHVHGYDLTSGVVPGSPASISFVADIPGVFEIELEDSGLLLFELEVR